MASTEGIYCGLCNGSYSKSQSSLPSALNGDDANNMSYKSKNGYNCYQPSGCNADRNGDPIYSCVAAQGDQIHACQSTCVSGSLQDYTRKLFNNTFGGKETAVTYERGVELYESLGLQTTGSSTGALYGVSDTDPTDADYSGPDNSKASSKNPSYSSINSIYNAKMVKGNTIYSLGRKVCLYGCVEFALFDYGLLPVYISGFDKQSDDFAFYLYGTGCVPDLPFPSYNCFMPVHSGYTDMDPIVNYLKDNFSITNNPYNISHPFLSGWVYRIRFNAGSESMERSYNYFGHSAVEIYSSGNKRYRFDDTNSNVNKTLEYKYLGLKYFLTFWDDDTKTLWIDGGFWYIIPNINSDYGFNPPQYLTSSNYPRDWTLQPGDNYPTEPVVLSPPSPITHAYDGIAGYTDLLSAVTPDSTNTGSSKNLENPVFNSGFKSMYIPPHMEVQGFSETRIAYKVLPVNNVKDYQYRIKANPIMSDRSTHPGSCSSTNNIYCITLDDPVNQIPLPFNYEQIHHSVNSPFQWPDEEQVSALPLNTDTSVTNNGVFVTLGTNLPNSIQRFLGSTDNKTIDLNNIYNDRYVEGSGSKKGNAGGIYNGALNGIKVAVRTTASFYDLYVSQEGNNTAIGNFIIPEILLNPGFYQGGAYVSGAQQVTNPKNYEFDSFQKITDPTDFWTVKNKYYDNKNVELNTDIDPWKCLPDMSASTAKKAVRYIPDAVVNRIHKTKLAKKLNKIKIGNLPIMSTSSPSNTSTTDNLRIKSFDVINGIYSIEWIYVLMYCAIKCQQNVTYDVDTKKYTYSCEGALCCQQCMLFNDPYLVSTSYSGSTNFDSVSLMVNYTGLRNFTFMYAPIKSLNNTVNNNECQCMATSKFCPGEMTSHCNKETGDSISDYYYRGSNIKNEDCPDAVCNYCDISVIQVAAAAQDGEATGNTNYASIDQQCQTSGCGSGGGGGGGTPEPSEEDDDPDSSFNTTTIVILVIGIIIAIVVIVLVIFFIRKKAKDSSTSMDS